MPGLLAVGVFPQAAYQHGFLSFPLLAGLGFGAGLAGRVVAEQVGRGGRRGWAWGVGGGLAFALVLAMGLLSGLAALRGLPVARGGVRVFDIPLPRSFHVPPAGIPSALPRALGAELAAATPRHARVATPDLDLNLWIPVGFYADRRLVFGCDTERRLVEAGAEYLVLPRMRLGACAPLVRTLQARGLRPRLGRLTVLFRLDGGGGSRAPGSGR